MFKFNILVVFTFYRDFTSMGMSFILTHNIRRQIPTLMICSCRGSTRRYPYYLLPYPYSFQKKRVSEVLTPSDLLLAKNLWMINLNNYLEKCLRAIFLL